MTNIEKAYSGGIGLRTVEEKLPQQGIAIAVDESQGRVVRRRMV